MDPGVLLQSTVGGLAAGAVLALVAIGFTVVAGTVRVLHLAHGDLVVAAVFTGVVVVLGRTPVAASLAPAPALGFTAVVLGSGVLLSALVGAVAVRPYLRDLTRGREVDPLGWIAGLLAAGLVLREVYGLLLPQERYAVPDPLRLDAVTASGVFSLPGGGSLPARVPVVLALGLLVALVADRVLVRSHFGRALRAVADDPEAAALCGVPARRVVIIAFAAAGLLAGVAGLLDAPGRALGIDDGVLLGFGAIAAALLGGLGSLRGAVAGGLVVGVLQAWVVQADARLATLVPLVLVVVALAVRQERRTLA